MPLYRPSKDAMVVTQVDGRDLSVLSSAACDAFDVSLLGLGDLSRPAHASDAIAVVFDLAGFTNFGKQIEPQLAVPLFMNEFLPWLMNQLKSEMIRAMHPAGAQLWSPLPFFVKFLGDGVLVLWDAANMSEGSKRNIIQSSLKICQAYRTSFLKGIQHKIVEPPEALRCGGARGTVYSVGDGSDFVGSCINMAARLQKLPGITFAYNRRGFDLEGAATKFFEDSVVIRKVAIRGIGDNELVLILRREFEGLRAADKAAYRAP